MCTAFLTQTNNQFIPFSFRLISALLHILHIPSITEICGRKHTDGMLEMRSKGDDRWVWIGHTLWKPASTFTRQAPTWNPQGKRKGPRNMRRMDPLTDTKRTSYSWRELEKKPRTEAFGRLPSMACVPRGTTGERRKNTLSIDNWVMRSSHICTVLNLQPFPDRRTSASLHLLLERNSPSWKTAIKKVIEYSSHFN